MMREGLGAIVVMLLLVTLDHLIGYVYSYHSHEPIEASTTGYAAWRIGPITFWYFGSCYTPIRKEIPRHWLLQVGRDKVFTVWPMKNGR